MRLSALRPPPRPSRNSSSFWPAIAASLTLLGAAARATPAPAGDAAEAKRFDLETSDGVSLATWLYEPAADAEPLANVILVHDLDGSHKTVEPLALALREAGCTVAAPDLRGHAASKAQDGRDSPLDSRQLRKCDLELIASGAGGRLREQSAVRGDLETVHAFLLSGAAAAGSARAPLVVIGCGAGATLAAVWTAADWAWPPLASGPQGQHVKALVLVSPAWVAKGLSLQPVLGAEPLKRGVPVLVLAGAGDRDAIRLFEHLKRQRPRDWFDQRAGAKADMGKDVDGAKDASLILLQLDTTLSSEKLVDDADAAGLIRGFLRAALDDDSR